MEEKPLKMSHIMHQRNVNFNVKLKQIKSEQCEGKDNSLRFYYTLERTKGNIKTFPILVKQGELLTF